MRDILKYLSNTLNRLYNELPIVGWLYTITNYRHTINDIKIYACDNIVLLDPMTVTVSHNSNPVVEQRYQMALAIHHIRKQHDIRVPTDPVFLQMTIGSYMANKKHSRWDGDIRQAVELWCICPYEAELRYGHISKWDTTNVTNMSELFFCGYSKEFNDSISNWDVSNVTNMSQMFLGAESFNQPIGQWNVSKVTNMEDMFYRASSFNHDISRWDIDMVTNAKDMFTNCPISTKNKPTTSK